MKTCVCGESMSILVNGSLTEEIYIRRGFGGLTRNTVRLNLFKGFGVGGNGVMVLGKQQWKIYGR